MGWPYENCENDKRTENKITKSRTEGTGKKGRKRSTLLLDENVAALSTTATQNERAKGRI